MNEAEQAASDFLTESLRWTETMAPAQIVNRAQLVSLLVRYRGAPSRSTVMASRPAKQKAPTLAAETAVDATQKAAPPKNATYVRISYSVNDAQHSAWAIQQKRPSAGVLAFDVCDDAGVPIGRSLRLISDDCEVSAARLVQDTLELAE